jgi:uncharacterized membrane protein
VDRPAPAGVLAAMAVGAQIAYPLLSGDALRSATVLAVLLFAAASLAHARERLGWSAVATVLGCAGGLGLAAEAVGVRTGVPFGAYTYADSLGPRLLGVPVVVPLAWTMMAYPCLLLGRRLAGRLGGDEAGTAPAAIGRAGMERAAVTLFGAAALAAWDLYLDPQMAGAGHWTWLHPEPALPGVPGVPLTNYAGWLVVAASMIALLDAVLPRDPDECEGVPAALLTWTWLGSALGNLAFFDRPGVAVYGFVGMGATVGPYLSALRTSRASPSRRLS